jgi:hypothetical protein
MRIKNQETKTEIVILRTTPAEKQEIKEAGKKFGGLSNWVRSLVVPASEQISGEAKEHERIN